MNSLKIKQKIAILKLEMIRLKQLHKIQLLKKECEIKKLRDICKHDFEQCSFIGSEVKCKICGYIKEEF